MDISYYDLIEHCDYKKNYLRTLSIIGLSLIESYQLFLDDIFLSIDLLNVNIYLLMYLV